MTTTPLRVLFAVQGEGRGHLTQALALAAMLRRRGHQIVGAIAGTSRWGDVPDFFRRDLGARVETVESPGFVADATGRIRPVGDARRRPSPRPGATAPASTASPRRSTASNPMWWSPSTRG